MKCLNFTPEDRAEMFKALQEDLGNQFYTDVKISFVDNNCSRSITCHRLILSSVPYFHKLFSTFADSLSQKEFTVHVDDAVVGYDFLLSLYQLEGQADYPPWLHTLKTIKLRDFFCLDSDASQLYDLVVPPEGWELLADVSKLFDVEKDIKLRRTLRKILPADLITTYFTQEIPDSILRRDKYFLVAFFYDDDVCDYDDYNYDDDDGHIDAIELRNLKTKELIETFTGPRGHSDAINSLIKLTDNQHFLSAADDKTIKLWNIKSGQHVRTFAGYRRHTGPVTALHLADDQHFLSAGVDQTIKLWNISSGECIRTFAGARGHTGSVESLLLVDNQYFLSAADDQTIKLWNIGSEECVRTFVSFREYLDCVNSMILSPDKQHFLSGDEGGNVKLWSIASGECIRTFAGPLGHTKSVNSLLLVDNQHFLSGSHDATAKLWNIANGQHIRTFEGHSDYINSLLLAGDGHFLSTSWDKTIKRWNIASGECVETTTLEGTPFRMVLYEE